LDPCLYVLKSFFAYDMIFQQFVLLSLIHILLVCRV